MQVLVVVDMDFDCCCVGSAWGEVEYLLGPTAATKRWWYNKIAKPHDAVRSRKNFRSKYLG